MSQGTESLVFQNATEHSTHLIWCCCFLYSHRFLFPLGDEYTERISKEMTSGSVDSLSDFAEKNKTKHF